MEIIEIISSTLGVSQNKIKDITVLKKGMTNRSYLFSMEGKRYILRIPGEGTDRLINRKQETDVYNIIRDLDICDRIIYINENTGIKITEYFENARVCDTANQNDLVKCMDYLRRFHELGLRVDHEFDIVSQIEYYESLWGENESCYADYKLVKEKVLSLATYVNGHVENKVLSHIDSIPDNFLFVDNDGSEEIHLIDWEYAGMQDPHVDIAMFCIYAIFDRNQVDNLIDIYFKGVCNKETRIKIYCYIAMCGLLWSNWCEYKHLSGVDFGEYAIDQYNYAKEYYEIVMGQLNNE